MQKTLAEAEGRSGGFKIVTLLNHDARPALASIGVDQTHLKLILDVYRPDRRSRASRSLPLSATRRFLGWRITAGRLRIHDLKVIRARENLRPHDQVVDQPHKAVNGVECDACPSNSARRLPCLSPPRVNFLTLQHSKRQINLAPRRSSSVLWILLWI